MANVHFVKEGGGEMYAKRVHALPTAEASEVLSGFAAQFSEATPIINPGIPASKDSPYKFVVLEVEPGEETSRFPKPGFYLFTGLKPAECARKLGIYL